jgi:hypothetical protein
MPTHERLVNKPVAALSEFACISEAGQANVPLLPYAEKKNSEYPEVWREVSVCYGNRRKAQNYKPSCHRIV